MGSPFPILHSHMRRYRFPHDRFISIADAYGSKLAFVNRELYFFVKNLAQGRAARGISSESIWKSACMMTFKDFLFVIKKIRFYFIDFQI